MSANHLPRETFPRIESDKDVLTFVFWATGEGKPFTLVGSILVAIDDFHSQMVSVSVTNTKESVHERTSSSG